MGCSIRAFAPLCCNVMQEAAAIRRRCMRRAFHFFPFYYFFFPLLTLEFHSNGRIFDALIRRYFAERVRARRASQHRSQTRKATVGVGALFRRNARLFHFQQRRSGRILAKIRDYIFFSSRYFFLFIFFPTLPFRVRSTEFEQCWQTQNSPRLRRRR